MRKRAISIILALCMVCTLMPSVGASGIPSLTVDQTWSGQWSSKTDYYYFNLTIPESGYYNIHVIDYNDTGYFTLESYDSDPYLDCYLYWLDTYDRLSADFVYYNEYIEKGDYEIRCSYCDYSDNNANANLSITFESSDFVPDTITETSKQFVLTANSNCEFKIHTSEAGDYVFKSNNYISTLFFYSDDHSYFDGVFSDYECGFKNCIFKLEANKDYYLSFYTLNNIGESGLPIRLSFSKTELNIEDIQISSQYRKLSGSSDFDESDFDYEVTFDNGSSSVMSLYELEEYGLPDLYVYYNGKYNTLTDEEEIYETGEQSVIISSHDFLECESTITISSYYDCFSYLSPISEYDDFYIDPENGQYATYYWHINMDYCGMYGYYDDGSMEEALRYWNIRIFDENNNEIPFDDDINAWPLVGGVDYILQFDYGFSDYYEDQVWFYFRNIVAEHSYSKVAVYEPTESKMGYSVYACGCGDWYMADYTIAAPTLKITTSAGKPQISWNAVDGATKYYIYRSTDGGKTYKYVTYTSSTSYTDSKATVGTKYSYKVVAAATIDGTTVKSDYSNATKPITCTTAAPTISIARSNGKPKLSWKAVTGATKYYIYRSTDGKTYSYLTSTTSTSYTNTGAASGKKYYYKVKAIKVVNGTAVASAYSNEKSLFTTLTAPTVSITRSSGKPKISWKAVTGADKYIIYRSTDGKTFSQLTTTTKLSYTNTKATKNKTYYYKVKAVTNQTSAATSAYSKAVSIKATK